MNVAYPTWDGALRKQHTLHIVSFISHRPERKGTLASDLKGAGPLSGLLKVFYLLCIYLFTRFLRMEHVHDFQ